MNLFHSSRFIDKEDDTDDTFIFVPSHRLLESQSEDGSRSVGRDLFIIPLWIVIIISVEQENKMIGDRLL
jgi:hypothetical protein